ncbi:stage II sporulation protein M [Metabacillus fastidiosus]|uniref:stage II sporulation protein M n=1 Tax=Metabacillus fastidiosus TaxID=1458 RepID=UPI002E1AF2C6|nr:stage II sporulation protein M [Metabacillus fastidiosus]
MTNLVNKIVFKRAINFFIFAVTITIIAAIATYIINPDLKETIRGLGNRTPDQIRESVGLDKVWSYIVNNGFEVPLQMFILALIPIQFLYVINVILTVSLPGILFGIVLRADLNTGLGIIISAVPHYIFEVLAFCLFAAILFELNKAIRIKVKSIFKKEKLGISLNKKILETIKIYVVLTLPIIIVAAFLETYIADIIFDLFR